MSPELGGQLERIFETVAVLSPCSWRCGEETIEAKPEEIEAKLTEFLYHRCYIRWFGEDGSGHGSGDLAEALRAAHPGRPPRDMGWRAVEAVEGGWIVATKGGAARRFAPGRYLVRDGSFGPPAKDQPLLVWPGRDSVDVQPSYYYAFSDTVGECYESEDLLRFYWNISADGAPHLLRALVGGLNRFQTPFQFKLPRQREGYGRRDTAVLYFNRRYFGIVAQIAARVHAELGEYLDEPVPLFTRRLARGLALAEDPNESFGMHRCRILAGALREAHERGLESGAQKTGALERRFGELGLSLEQPHLNAGSRDEYDLPGDGGPHRRAALP
jgi:hypothetical protein